MEIYSDLNEKELDKKIDDLALKKEWDNANTACTYMRNYFPDSSIGFIKGSVALRELGKTNEALEILNSSILNQPHASPANFFQKARTLMLMESYQDALDIWQNLYKLYPNNSDIILYKSFCLMCLKKWQEACYSWENMREKYPDNQAGFIQGGIVAKEMLDYDGAVRLWLNVTDIRKAIFMISEIIEKIQNDSLYDAAFMFLLSEKFNGEHPTVIVMKVHGLFYNHKALYDKYIYKIRHNIDGLENIDYFTLVALGFINNPDRYFMRKIFKTGCLKLIQTISSSEIFHINNIKTIKSDSSHSFCPDRIIKRAFDNLFLKQSPSFFSAKKNKKLKIALCISGQLRGYTEAYKTWKLFNFDEHIVDTYCCVWEKIGRKGLAKSINQLARVFNPNFLHAYVDYTEGMPIGEIRNIFSNLFEILNKSSSITQNEINTFYSAEESIIVRDTIFSEKNNAFKMYYMIEKCWKLIQVPESYDLLIRIRPDKRLNLFNANWLEILNFVSRGNLIADSRAQVHPSSSGLIIGDQFAVSTPKVMEKYSKTFSSLSNGEGCFSERNYNTLLPHQSLFVSMLQNGYYVYDLGDSVDFGSPIDPEKLSNKLLLKLIELDFKENDAIRGKFVDAILKDMAVA